jgi:cbb3-type cytochrome oxidase maturation protein
MTYVSLAVIFVVLIIGATATLTILFWSMRSGQFRNLKSGAYVIFDDDEPVGEPQDQLFREDAADEAGDDRPSS